VKPSAEASGVIGSTAPTGAHTIGGAIIARLGPLVWDGLRRVRMTKTTSVCVASDSTNHPVRNSAWPALRTSMTKKASAKSRAPPAANPM